MSLDQEWNPSLPRRSPYDHPHVSKIINIHEICLPCSPTARIIEHDKKHCLQRLEMTINAIMQIKVMTKIENVFADVQSSIWTTRDSNTALTEVIMPVLVTAQHLVLKVALVVPTSLTSPVTTIIQFQNAIMPTITIKNRPKWSYYLFISTEQESQTSRSLKYRPIPKASLPTEVLSLLPSKLDISWSSSRCFPSL